MLDAAGLIMWPVRGYGPACGGRASSNAEPAAGARPAVAGGMEAVCSLCGDFFGLATQDGLT